MWIYVKTDKLVWQRRGLQLSRSKGMGAMRRIGAKSSFKMGERLYLEVLGPFLRRATSKQGLAACHISPPAHGGWNGRSWCFIIGRWSHQRPQGYPQCSLSAR